MYPVLPFAVGLLTGAVAVRLLKSVNLRAGLDKAQDRLREATVSGLSAIEHSSAELKSKLMTPAPEAAETGASAETAAPPPEAAAAEAKPARRAPRRRAAAPAKAAAGAKKAPAGEEGAA